MEAELRISRTPDSQRNLLSAVERLEGIEQEAVSRISKELNAMPLEPQEISTFLYKVEQCVESSFTAKIRPLIFKHLELGLFYPVYDRKDFTFFLDSKKQGVSEAVTYFLRRHSDTDAGLSYDCRVKIQDSDSEHAVRSASGRVLACSCFGGEYFSFTFRKESEGGEPYPTRREHQKSKYEARKNSSEEYFNTIDDLCRTVKDLLRTQLKPEARGLVVVTGRTFSAKSEITRGLICNYLSSPLPNNPGKSGRVPHLLTFEDPIETQYFGPKVSPIEAQRYGIDYTARQKHKDALSLADALQDALRQTPAVVFVGETREEDEWKALISFAGTGHLVFTTAHAGSLSEAMGKIFQQTGTKTPSDRSVIADRLLALIHVRYEQVGEKAVLIPALWRNTPEGAKALVAEGRSSLLPHNGDESFCIGRYWFAKKLAKNLAASGNPAAEEIKTQALAWDIEGS